MREYSTALQVQVPTTGNLTDDVVRNAVESPDAVAFSRRTADGWRDVTAAQFHDEVRAVAKGLVAAGVEIRPKGARTGARTAAIGPNPDFALLPSIALASGA